jgi:hypothetical protein
MPANFIHLNSRLPLSQTLDLSLERLFINISSFRCRLRKKFGLSESICERPVQI